MRDWKRFLAVLAAFAPGAAFAADGDASFVIMRKGEPIGRHVVEVREAGGKTLVDTNIRMRVKFGPLVLYRYDHQSREVWANGAVEEIQSRTDDNGDKAELKAHRVGGRLYVQGTGFHGYAPEGAAPSSYWTKSVVSAPMLLNTQNGEVMQVTSTPVGVTTSPGGEPGEQFRIVGTLALDLWYDGDNWIGSDFTIDGERLTYVPEAGAIEESRLVSAE